VEQQQLDVEKLVGELEIGVDRLRSLYEQYFMGIEKLEPTVPRKDVDRRIHVLRKEQIRNTALRFRFQMIIQRYNTYQTHWQRICREIENGTYKRHVLRANRRFESTRRSTAPPPRRSSMPPKLDPGGGSHPPASQPPIPPPAPLGFPQPGAALPIDLASELAELEREFGPVATGPVLPGAPPPARPAALPAGPRPPAAAPPVVARPVAAPPPAAARPAPAASDAARPAPPARPPIPPQPRAPALPAAGAATPARPGQTPPAAARPQAPAPQPPARAPSAQATTGAVELSDQRVRALYEQYVDAKRRQKESTAAITYDAVAKSLRDSSAKLRQKHGKSVDFEVTIREGKAILRPVLK
jgi:hypothetical protein